jgi:hypothetical protein
MADDCVVAEVGDGRVYQLAMLVADRAAGWVLGVGSTPQSYELARTHHASYVGVLITARFQLIEQKDVIHGFIPNPIGKQ